MRDFDLYYHPAGAGTTSEPVVITFTFRVLSPSLDELREQLPDTVLLTETGPKSFRLTGVTPEMTRVEALAVFDKLVRDNGWKGKHFA
ncbi:MAG TPA: hypothetical protein VLG36_00095 [Candidatus Chromulinivoraceae bacterium]|nr:hypothetical protein [Candidatus Chromulinivoraceae bacterium]